MTIAVDRDNSVTVDLDLKSVFPLSEEADEQTSTCRSLQLPEIFGLFTTGIEFMSRFLKIFLLLVALVSNCRYAHAAQPTFDQYPSDEVVTGPRSPLRILKGRDRTFRTALSRFEKAPINFAGHYVLATIGCGASCILIAAIDVMTGRVIWAPFNSVCCWDDVVDQPIEFRRNSGLVVLNGLLNETGERGRHYFRLTKGTFVPVQPN